MPLPALVICYLISAAILVFFSIKCADYVDILDKKTKLSGAFIGGVILAAVTSLPELVTSISSIYAVHNAELIIGNVLGSDIFNLCIFGALTAVTLRGYAHASLGKSHLATLACTLVAYAATAVTLFTGYGKIPVVNIQVASLVILAVYIISTRFLSKDTAKPDTPDDSPLTVKQVAVRFSLMAVGLVLMSVLVTTLTDSLAEKLNLNASLAGALFLGIATSLPELSSSIQLVKRKNYNAMVGNIAGSNLFNFTILSVADIIAGNTPVFVDSTQTRAMLIFGVLSTLLCMLSVFFRRRSEKFQSMGAIMLYSLCGAGILACYAAFLVMSWI